MLQERFLIKWFSVTYRGSSQFVKSLSRELKKEMKVREAVVAIPFRNVNGEKQLFPLTAGNQSAIELENIIEKIKNRTRTVAEQLSATSIESQIQKMTRYHFPPYLDFIKYPDRVEPYSAYIFEFEHTFSEDDLSYIWQNLTPPSGQVIEEVEQTVAHRLQGPELLSNPLNQGRRIKLPEDIQWMVFKVKQKAKTNYERDILGRKVVGSREVEEKLFGFNWPYDHFSLVEMGKLDVAVDMIPTAIASQGITNNADGQTIELDASRTNNDTSLPLNTGSVDTNLPDNIFNSGPTITNGGEI